MRPVLRLFSEQLREAIERLCIRRVAGKAELVDDGLLVGLVHQLHLQDAGTLALRTDPLGQPPRPADTGLTARHAAATLRSVTGFDRISRGFSHPMPAFVSNRHRGSLISRAAGSSGVRRMLPLLVVTAMLGTFGMSGAAMAEDHGTASFAATS